MDTNDLRVIITVVLFVVFLGIVYWAYSSRQKGRFDEAANLPFADDEMQQRTVDKAKSAELKDLDSQTSKSRSEEKSHG